MAKKSKYTVAVLLPAYNEEEGIAHVVDGFRKSMPDARLIVCDNNSKDKTSENARKVGAEVYFQPLPGKGNAMRRLFREVEADVYIMCDADGSYDASAAPMLVDKLIDEKLDMIVASRQSGDEKYRARVTHWAIKYLAGSWAWPLGDILMTFFLAIGFLLVGL